MEKFNDVKVGETTTVTSVVYPQIATVNKATYTTDNSSISTCDGNGNVQGKGEGYTRISATAENKKQFVVYLFIHNVVTRQAA